MKEIVMQLSHNVSHAPSYGSSARVSPGGLIRASVRALDFLSPVLDLGIRALVAGVFFESGLTKIASWETTLLLFDSEYSVPFLPPELAAYLGTAAELALPVFLLFGLGSRFAALALFVFNIIAVISYPDLSAAGLKDHQYWGLLLLVTLFHGPGKLSIDYLLGRIFRRGKANEAAASHGGPGDSHE
jgi:putative oxidoreductase